jgi:hypothetical protein
VDQGKGNKARPVLVSNVAELEPEPEEMHHFREAGVGSGSDPGVKHKKILRSDNN